MSKSRNVVSFLTALAIPFLLAIAFVAAILLLMEAAFNSNFMKGWSF